MKNLSYANVLAALFVGAALSGVVAAASASRAKAESAAPGATARGLLRA